MPFSSWFFSQPGNAAVGNIVPVAGRLFPGWCPFNGFRWWAFNGLPFASPKVFLNVDGSVLSVDLLTFFTPAFTAIEPLVIAKSNPIPVYSPARYVPLHLPPHHLSHSRHGPCPLMRKRGHHPPQRRSSRSVYYDRAILQVYSNNDVLIFIVVFGFKSSLGSVR